MAGMGKDGGMRIEQRLTALGLEQPQPALPHDLPVEIEAEVAVACS
jgi:hypothetical protein